MRLVTVEERERTRRFDELVRYINMALLVLLGLICAILFYGWIMW